MEKFSMDIPERAKQFYEYTINSTKKLYPDAVFESFEELTQYNRDFYISAAKQTIAMENTARIDGGKNELELISNIHNRNKTVPLEYIVDQRLGYYNSMGV